MNLIVMSNTSASISIHILNLALFVNNFIEDDAGRSELLLDSERIGMV